MPKVLIADDHPLFRDAIRDVVERLFVARGWDLSCQEAANLGDVEQLTGAGEDLDLILLDLFMPGANGLSQLVSLRSRLPAVPVVVISSLADAATVKQAITCGAAGFIPKSTPKDLIATALGVVFDGGIYVPNEVIAAESDRTSSTRSNADDSDSGPLTPRQVKVLALVSDGKSNKQIAYELSISEMTVKAHMTAILRKLGVSSRAQAIVMFQRQLVPHPIRTDI